MKHGTNVLEMLVLYLKSIHFDDLSFVLISEKDKLSAFLSLRQASIAEDRTRVPYAN